MIKQKFKNDFCLKIALIRLRNKLYTNKKYEAYRICKR